MPNPAYTILRIVAAGIALTCPALFAQAQSADQMVRQVVQNELRADATQNTFWMYKDAKKTPERSTTKIVIETPHGNVSRMLDVDGHPLSPEQREQDEQKIRSMVTDPAVQQKQRRDSKEDGQKARNMMKMLPDAFIWTVAGGNNGEVSLSYKPNPKFQPPDRETQVMSLMAGTMTVDRAQMRLKVLKGALTQDVDFGWGILGRLRKGGTFSVARTEVAPNEWQIVETHVHISGRALLFKSIDQNEDETNTYIKHVAPSLTLEQAASLLHQNEANLNAQAQSASSLVQPSRP